MSGFEAAADRLRLLDCLGNIAGQAYSLGHFVSPEAFAAAQADLQARREGLEVEAGVRRRPVAVAPITGPQAPVA